MIDEYPVKYKTTLLYTILATNSNDFPGGPYKNPITKIDA